jgi:hypothetical protein
VPAAPGFFSRDAIDPEEFILRFKLDDRVIPTRVKRFMRSLPGTLQGAKAFRYGVEFVSIAADDWDAVVRWTKGGSAAERRQQSQARPRDGPHVGRRCRSLDAGGVAEPKLLNGLVSARPSRPARAQPAAARAVLLRRHGAPQPA